MVLIEKSLLIAIPFGFQYIRYGISKSKISRTHPLGRSYPLPDDSTNFKIFMDSGKFEFSLMTSYAFLHSDSFSIGLRHSFPAAEIEYDWMWSE